MQLRTRKMLDRSFSGFGFFSIAVMAAALLILLVPIFYKGTGAFFFKGTVEFRRFQLDLDEEEAIQTTYDDLLDTFADELEAKPHLQLSLTDDIPRLLEQATRLAGGYTPRSVQKLNREDLSRRRDAANQVVTMLLTHFGDESSLMHDDMLKVRRERRRLLELADVLVCKNGFDSSSRDGITRQIMEASQQRAQAFAWMHNFEQELEAGKYDNLPQSDDLYDWFEEVKDDFHNLLGPVPVEIKAVNSAKIFCHSLSTEDTEYLYNFATYWVARAQDTNQTDKDLFAVQLNHLQSIINELMQPLPQSDDYRKLVEQALNIRQKAVQSIAYVSSLLAESPYQSLTSPYLDTLQEIKDDLNSRLETLIEEDGVILASGRYGRTRWDDRAKFMLHRLLNREVMVYPEDENGNPLPSRVEYVFRGKDFTGTSLQEFFTYMQDNTKRLLVPKFTFYWRFLFDPSKDSHMLGGIWAEILGTFYLALGAMLFAVPLGVIAAIYLAEFAKEGRVVSLLRTFISTLAGVPSIVFGLFGLAFFINTLGVSEGRSVLAGSLTLSILILPTIIRASEEAIRAVPHTYKEASLALGASRWYSVVSVILPAAMPGILTGIVISMGRAAGETAPIIFTAAISFGDKIKFTELLTNGTRVLSWNIYNLASEHPAVDEIRHVQYGMVMVLIGLVVLLNLAAIVLRAQISKKLRG